jgi:hypothetical protein
MFIAKADGFFLEYGERGVSLSIRWLSIVRLFFHILGVLARGKGSREQLAMVRKRHHAEAQGRRGRGGRGGKTYIANVLIVVLMYAYFQSWS